MSRFLCSVLVAATTLIPRTAAAQLSVSPTPTQFGDQIVGTTSAPQTITVVNSGAAVTMGAALLSGADSVSYSATNGCLQVTLETASSCIISVTFAPLHTGSAEATLSVADVSGAHISVIQLSGNGTGAQPTYAVPSFQVTVADMNVPPNSFPDLSYWGGAYASFNNHDHFAGSLNVRDNGCPDYTGDGAHWSAFYYAGGQWVDLSKVAGSLIAAADPATGCQIYSYAVGIDDADNVYGQAIDLNGVMSPVTFADDGSSMKTIDQIVTDGTASILTDFLRGFSIQGHQVPIRVFSNGVVLFSGGASLQNGSIKEIAPCSSPTTSANGCIPSPSFFDVPSFSWVTGAPFAGGAFGYDVLASSNSQGLVPTFLWANGVPSGALLSKGTVTDALVPNGYFSSVNAAGQAVGVRSSPNPHPIPWFAFGTSGEFISDPNGTSMYWDPRTGAQNLDSLLPDGWSTAGTAPLINDQGHIFTIVIDSTDTPHLAILAPVTVMPTGNNVAVQSGSTTLTFSSVTAPGSTTVTPIDASTTGTLPGGFAISDTVAYQIQTTATFSGPVTVAFVVPGPMSQADFNLLRVLHNENGSLVDITSGSDYFRMTIYGTASSFSPFYLERQGAHIAPLFDTAHAHRLGSTVPIKLQVLSGANVNLSSATLPVKARKLIRLQDSTSPSVTDSGNSTPDLDFRFDSTIGQTGGYIFNLSTRDLSSGRYSLSMNVGSDKAFVYSVVFEVR
jgi:hypothetical protein